MNHLVAMQTTLLDNVSYFVKWKPLPPAKRSTQNEMKGGFIISLDTVAVNVMPITPPLFNLSSFSY